jgi:predicted HNH restriction endonuclease
VPWSHQVPVKWESDFAEVKILLRGEQVTVLELSQEDLNKIEANRKEAEKSNQKKEAIEGGVYKRETLFRARNRALIQAKKVNSNYCCEACGFNFFEEYGEIGKHFIIAHHIVPMSAKRKPIKTTLDDIALLCANCHAMVHVKHPPLSISDLKITGRK